MYLKGYTTLALGHAVTKTNLARSMQTAVPSMPCGCIMDSYHCYDCCKKGKIERDLIPNERREDLVRQEYAQYRDSILNETEPLLGDAEAIQDVATY